MLTLSLRPTTTTTTTTCTVMSIMLLSLVTTLLFGGARTMALENSSTSLLALQETETMFLQNLYEVLGIYHDNDNKTTTSTVCAWKGIECNSDGLVVLLDLSSIASTSFADTTAATPSSTPLPLLPWDWRPLTHLQRLLLRNNKWSQPLPIYLPSTLIHLNVDRNQFVGTIPNQWSELVYLERLILSDNSLEGELVTDPLCSLLQLKALNVARNQRLVGTLPGCLASLSHLNSLDMTGTRLIGPLPHSLLTLCDKVSDDDDDDTLPSQGFCQRFGFCMDGYREEEVKSEEEDGVPTSTTTCVSCPDPSNVLASPICEWIENENAPSPIPRPTSEAPTINPTMHPLEEPPGYFSTTAPSKTPTSSVPVSSSTVAPSTIGPLSSVPISISMTSTSPSSLSSSSYPISRSNDDEVPIAIPSMTIPVESSPPSQSPLWSIDGIQEPPSDFANQDEEHLEMFWDGPAFVPILVLFSVLSAVAWLVVLPTMIWMRRRNDGRVTQNRTSSSSSNSSNGGGGSARGKSQRMPSDNPWIPLGQYYYDADDQDEVIFTKEKIIDDREDLIVDRSLFSDYEADFGLSMDDTTPKPMSTAKSTTMVRTTEQSNRLDPPGRSRGSLVVQPETWMKNPRVRFTLGPNSSDTSIDDIFPSWSGIISHDDPFDGLVVLGNSSSISSTTNSNTTPMLNTMKSPKASARSVREVTDSGRPFCFRPPQYYKRRTNPPRRRKADERSTFRIDSCPAVLGIRSPFFDWEEQESVDKHEKSDWKFLGGAKCPIAL